MTSRLPAVSRTAAPAQLPPPGLAGMDPRFSRLVEASGRTWHLLDNAEVIAEAGVEPRGTVLCVHGNPTWSYLWRSLVAQATEQAIAGGDAWRVIAVDQLDMGFSERTGVERDLTLRVGDLADLTDALELDGPVVTFGHDWGGVISLGWAVDHPALLAGAMLLNTAVAQPSDAKIPAPLRFALGRGVLGKATVTTTAFLETTLALAHPALSPEIKDAFRAPYREARRRGGIGAFVADIPVDETHPSEAERRRVAEGVRDLDVPTLMLWGPRDPIFSDRYLDDLRTRIPHADVHRFEGAGHLVAEDVDFAAAALTWLGDRFGDQTESTADDVASGSPSAGTALWNWLADRATDDGTALVEMSRTPGERPRVVTWRSLARRVTDLAAGLREAGVEPGDRVSLLVQPGVDLTAVLYACLRIGAVVVVADAGLGLRGLTRAVRGAWPDHVIGARPGLAAARALGWPGRKISVEPLPAALRRALGVEASLPELVATGAARRFAADALPPEPSADAEAAILFTSGSTGPAKGVSYTHGQLAAVVGALASTYGVDHETGLVAGFAPFALLGPALGARSVTPAMDVTAPRTLTAHAVAEAAAEVDATVVFLSPAALTNVVATSGDLNDDHREALAAVRLFLSAGAPVSPALLGEAALLMPNASAHTPYGMTEGLLMTDASLEQIRAASNEGQDTRGGSFVGRPVSGVRVLIAPLLADGTPGADLTDRPGVTGEIVVAAPHLEDHYDQLWLTDRSSRRGTPDGGRWHRTGDVGRLDADGALLIEGRLPHVITTPDGPVTPVGPEQTLESHPRVARAAVVGIGPVGTQQIVAIVETYPPARAARLADSAFSRELRALLPRPVAAVFAVPALPTDVRHNSKIDRSALAAWASEILAGSPVSDPVRRRRIGPGRR